MRELVFCGDLVYKFKRIAGKPTFTDQFKKIIKRYKMWYITWIIITCYSLTPGYNPIMIYSYGFLFNCAVVGQSQKVGKDLELVQPSTTTDPGYHIGK